MRIVLQRVTRGSVLVEGRMVSEIGPGYVLLVGIGQEDTEVTVAKMAEKVANLRVMQGEDGQPAQAGKMNQSVLEAHGEILVVSQFTLYADTSHGRRPYFGNAADPEKAKELIRVFVQDLSKYGVVVKEGEFGAHMKVELVNDGPVTIVLE